MIANYICGIVDYNYNLCQYETQKLQNEIIRTVSDSDSKLINGILFDWNNKFLFDNNDTFLKLNYGDSCFKHLSDGEFKIQIDSLSLTVIYYDPTKLKLTNEPTDYKINLSFKLPIIREDYLIMIIINEIGYKISFLK